VVLDSTAEVETPEHVRFWYRLAGPTRRGLAYLLDLLLRLGILLTVGMLVTLGLGGVERREQASTGVILVIAFVLEWGYYVAFESWWSGRTPGKRVFGLRVIKEGGYPLTFLDSVLRNLLRAADFLPAGYALGLLSMALDGRFRRLGDLVAGTMVVLEEARVLPAPLVLEPPLTPAEGAEVRGWPSRTPLSASERDALELFLRRDGLGAPRRRELAEMVAPALARRLGLAAAVPDAPAPTPASTPSSTPTPISALADPARFLALVYQRSQPPGPGAAPPP